MRGAMRWLVGLGVVATVGGCGPSGASAAAWPEADALMHRDARWLGGDAAYSVAIGGERTLWMFGDTFVATSEAHVRRESTMVRNTVAVQRGLDPVTASLGFAWRTAEDGRPASYLPEAGERWFWPLHGIERGGVLTTFWLEEAPGGGLGFEAVGARAIRTSDAATSDEASTWRWSDVELPQVSFGARIGASVLAFEGHVYAYAVEEPGAHDVWLLRWTEEGFDAGELRSPEWWDGRWVPHAELGGAPAVVIADAQTEFSVSAAKGGGFVLVQTEGFGATTIGVRTAPRPEGPWSRRTTVWRPPESEREGVLVYAAKAHPELEGEGLVVTYASNATDFGRLVADDTLYWPRFVRVERW